jgi:hypothetical protein
MKGDFTRFTYDRRKRYNGVLKQQGRVDLDADWNELVAIREVLATTTRTDVIGACGVPKVGGGFEIGGGADLTISGGRIYVDGILCETRDTTYSTQPFGPLEALIADGEEAGADGRTDLVYLDVWQRHVTAVEDPELLDPALNGADTTTRIQTVCQVKVRKGVAAVTCDDPVADFPPDATGTGTLSNQAVATPADADPCGVVVTGGYRGVENRLYRVEIHEAGPLGTATYKWSRDNGAVLVPVAEFPAAPANRIGSRSSTTTPSSLASRASRPRSPPRIRRPDSSHLTETCPPERTTWRSTPASAAGTRSWAWTRTACSLPR